MRSAAAAASSFEARAPRCPDWTLALYKRIPADAVRVDGDRSVFTELLAWSATE